MSSCDSSSEEDELDPNEQNTDVLHEIIKKLKARDQNHVALIKLLENNIERLKKKDGTASKHDPPTSKEPVASKDEEAMRDRIEELEHELKTVNETLEKKEDIHKRYRAATAKIQKNQETDHAAALAKKDKTIDRYCTQLDEIDPSFQLAEERNAELTKEITKLRDIILDSGGDAVQKLDNLELMTIAIGPEEYANNRLRITNLEYALTAARIPLPHLPGVDIPPTQQKRKADHAMGRQSGGKLKKSSKKPLVEVGSGGEGGSVSVAIAALPMRSKSSTESPEVLAVRFKTLWDTSQKEHAALKIQYKGLEHRFRQGEELNRELSYRAKSGIVELVSRPLLLSPDQMRKIGVYWNHATTSHVFDRSTCDFDLQLRIQSALIEFAAPACPIDPHQVEKTTSHWDRITGGNSNPCFQAIVTGIPGNGILQMYTRPVATQPTYSTITEGRVPITAEKAPQAEPDHAPITAEKAPQAEPDHAPIAAKEALQTEPETAPIAAKKALQTEPETAQIATEKAPQQARIETMSEFELMCELNAAMPDLDAKSQAPSEMDTAGHFGQKSVGNELFGSWSVEKALPPPSYVQQPIKEPSISAATPQIGPMKNSFTPNSKKTSRLSLYASLPSHAASPGVVYDRADVRVIDGQSIVAKAADIRPA